MSERGSRRGRSLLLGLLLALALGATWRVVRFALGFPLWGDEAFLAASFFDRGPAELAQPLEHGMVTPYAYLLATWVVTRILGLSEWALRLVPLLAGLAGLGLYARFARSALGRHQALVALALLAVSYYPVRHACEMKPYAVDLAVSGALLLLAWRVRRAPSRGRWIALGAALLLAPWFSYPSVFTGGGIVLALGILEIRRPRALLPVALVGAGLVAGFLAMYVAVGSGQQWREETVRAGQWVEQMPPLERPLEIPAWLWRQHTGRMLAYPNGGRSPGSLATTLLVIVGAVVLWRRGRMDLVLLLLLSLPLMLVAAALHRYPYGGSARTTQHLAGPICLLAGAGLVAVLRLVGRRRAPTAARVVTGLLLAMAIVGIASDVRKPYKNIEDRDVRDLVRAMARDSGPNDVWIVFGAFADRPGVPDLRSWGGSPARLAYYLKREAPGALRWGDDPASLPTSPRRLVLAYVDNVQPFPEGAWSDYLCRAMAVWGRPASARRAEIGGGREVLRVHIWE
jgi:hypothetical protein